MYIVFYFYLFISNFIIINQSRNRPNVPYMYVYPQLGKLELWVNLDKILCCMVLRKFVVSATYM